MAYKNVKQTTKHNKAGSKSAEIHSFSRVNRAPDNRFKHFAEMPYGAFRRMSLAPTKEDRVIRVANICFWLGMAVAAVLMVWIGHTYPF